MFLPWGSHVTITLPRNKRATKMKKSFSRHQARLLTPPKGESNPNIVFDNKNVNLFGICSCRTVMDFHHYFIAVTRTGQYVLNVRRTVHETWMKTMNGLKPLAYTSCGSIALSLSYIVITPVFFSRYSATLQYITTEYDSSFSCVEASVFPYTK